MSVRVNVRRSALRVGRSVITLFALCVAWLVRLASLLLSSHCRPHPPKKKRTTTEATDTGLERTDLAVRELAHFGLCTPSQLLIRVRLRAN